MLLESEIVAPVIDLFIFASLSINTKGTNYNSDLKILVLGKKKGLTNGEKDEISFF